MITVARYLAEVRAQFGEWYGGEGAFGVHDERPRPQTVQVTHDDEQVRRRLHRQETPTWYIDSYNRQLTLNKPINSFKQSTTWI